MKKRMHGQKGFTLAELLIVVAVIAVLVAIAIPIFSSLIEKSREATDAANIRAQYAAVMAAAIEADDDVNKDGADPEMGKIQLKQTVNYWQDTSINDALSELMKTEEGKEEPEAGCLAWVEYIKEEDMIYLRYSEGGASEGTPHITNWASTSSIGQQARSLMPAGTNTGMIYSTDEGLTQDQQNMIDDIKKKLGISGDVAVYYGWSSSNIKISVVKQSLLSTDYSTNNKYADWTYATRITYNPDNKEVLKVEEEYGKWGNNGGRVGFWANSQGEKYPTTVVYEKE